MLAQTYSDLEYIVVDGNSTDNTIDIIQEYEKRFDGKMRWISEPDNGLYDAINKGIQMATGDIVGIIHSDDFYAHNTVLEQVAEAFKKDTNIQAVFGDVRFVNPDDLNKTVRYYSSKKFATKRFRFGFMPAHPTFFTYKSNFEKLGYYETNYKIAADFELLLRFLYIHKLPYRYLPLDMITMRTGGLSTKSYKSNILLNKEIVKACKRNGVYTNLFLVYLKYFVKIFELVNRREG